MKKDIWYQHKCST